MKTKVLLVTVFVIAVLVNVVSVAVLNAQTQENVLPLSVDAALRVAESLSVWVIALSVVGTVIYLVVRGAPILARLLGKLGTWLDKAIEEEQPEEVPPMVVNDVSQVEDTMEEINRRIAIFDGRRAEVSIELNTINTLASTLVRLIQGVAAKADALKRQNEHLLKLDGAILAGDKLAIAEVCGMVQDAHITALATDEKGMAYINKLREMLALERGSSTAHVNALERLANTWLGQLSEYRQEMDRLALVIDSGEALPVIVEIQGRLQVAQETLGVKQDQLEAMMAMRHIPRIHVDPQLMIEDAQGLEA